jgi:PAS domain S-box-containing protein
MPNMKNNKVNKLNKSQLLRALEHAPIPLYIHKSISEGKFETIWMNDEIKKRSDNLTVKSVEDFDFLLSRVHPEDREKVKKAFQKDLYKKKLANVEFRWGDESGNYRYFFDRSVLVEGDESNPEVIVGSWMDITERVVAETELKQSENKYRLVVENSNDLVITTDVHAKITYSSPSSKRIVDYKPEELISKSLYKLLSKGEEGKLQSLFELLDTGKVQDVLLKINSRNKEVITLKGKARFIRGSTEENEPFHIFTMHDVTEREKRDGRKDVFFSTASHEMKTPLTSIKLNAQLLERKLRATGDEESSRTLEIMNAEINKVTRMIDDFFNLAKIKTGKMSFRMEPFMLNDVIKRATSEIQLVSEKHLIDVNMSRDVEIYGDSDRIGQVIINLLTNAIKYSPEANRVVVSTHNEKESVKVTIKDFGVGIPLKIQDKIFDHFYQYSHTLDKKGLGIGLYIAKAIIDYHGGEIWVKSSPGKGSEFNFTLPLNNTKTAK